MKLKLSLFLGIILAALNMHAQVAGGINDGLNYGLTLIPTIDKAAEDVEGSPFYNKDYARGTVLIEDKEPLKAYLRYNVAEERIEIKTHPESPRVYQLPSGSQAEYIVDSQTFVLDKIRSDGKEVFGYFIEEYDGENYRLLKKPIAIYKEGERAKTGYGKDKPAKITIEEEFYIVPKSGQAVNVRPRSKDVKKAFGSEDAQNYLKDNKIRSESDLVKFVAYLDKK